ncbi:MAG: protein translocase subunit SecD [Eubacteriales bacterium]|nr:protein translocase subunit SecD [bacterium]MDY2791549.1 protein translocase subunit SecD [Eubacteriales bacterium]
MKVKSLVTLGVTLLLIVLIGLLAVNGMHVGKYIFKSVGDSVSLGLDLRGGIYAVYLGDTSAEDFDAQMDATVTIMRTRLTNEGYTEATITRQGDDRIRIEIPDVSDPNEILNIVGTPAHLTFVDPDGNVVVEGSQIVEAYPAYDENNKPVVMFKMNDEATESFAKATTENIGKTISIQLDGENISTPTVQSAITEGSGMISGSSTIEEAQTLANLIMSGALPLDITLDSSSAVSATLGIDALSTSLKAGIIGLILVALFMIVMYRLPGVISVMALCIYTLVVMYAVCLVPGVQLTLPGIAGILLGIGMAVDGNVIIFERFREELKGGRSLEAAVNRGYKNALSSIIDSNVTTIIAGCVLLYFGTGSIKGFAMTLLIGVIASMISSVFVTRFLLKHLVRLGIGKNNLKLYSR